MTHLRRTIASGFALLLLGGCGGYAGTPLPAPNPLATPTPTGTGVAIPNDPGQGLPVVTSAPGAAASTPAAPVPTSAPVPGCPAAKGIDTVTFVASTKIRQGIVSFRVTLTQGAATGSAWTPADPTNPHGMPLVRGVLIDGKGTYTFIIGGGSASAVAIPGAWRPRPKATVLIEALASDGTSIYQQSKTFSFAKVYPDGRACDRVPSLVFATTLVEADRIAPAR